MAPQPVDVTQLLREWRDGHEGAEGRLFEVVLPELHRLAQGLMQRERRGHSLEPTELINQVYMKLITAREQDWQNRKHFFAIAARAMRRYLIDHARARPAAEKVPVEGLSELLASPKSNFEQAAMVDKLLFQMEAEHPDWCTIVELKFFVGLTDDEAAEVLHINVRKLQREWFDARRWLFERYGGEDPQH